MPDPFAEDPFAQPAKAKAKAKAKPAPEDPKGLLGRGLDVVKESVQPYLDDPLAALGAHAIRNLLPGGVGETALTGAKDLGVLLSTDAGQAPDRSGRSLPSGMAGTTDAGPGDQSFGIANRAIKEDAGGLGKQLFRFGSGGRQLMGRDQLDQLAPKARARQERRQSLLPEAAAGEVVSAGKAVGAIAEKSPLELAEAGVDLLPGGGIMSSQMAGARMLLDDKEQTGGEAAKRMFLGDPLANTIRSEAVLGTAESVGRSALDPLGFGRQDDPLMAKADALDVVGIASMGKGALDNLVAKSPRLKRAANAFRGKAQARAADKALKRFDKSGQGLELDELRIQNLDEAKPRKFLETGELEELRAAEQVSEDLVKPTKHLTRNIQRLEGRRGLPEINRRLDQAGAAEDAQRGLQGRLDALDARAAEARAPYQDRLGAIDSEIGRARNEGGVTDDMVGLGQADVPPDLARRRQDILDDMNANTTLEDILELRSGLERQVRDVGRPQLSTVHQQGPGGLGGQPLTGVTSTQASPAAFSTERLRRTAASIPPNIARQRPRLIDLLEQKGRADRSIKDLLARGRHNIDTGVARQRELEALQAQAGEGLQAGHDLMSAGGRLGERFARAQAGINPADVEARRLHLRSAGDTVSRDVRSGGIFRPMGAAGMGAVGSGNVGSQALRGARRGVGATAVGALGRKAPGPLMAGVAGAGIAEAVGVGGLASLGVAGGTILAGLASVKGVKALLGSPTMLRGVANVLEVLASSVPPGFAEGIGRAALVAAANPAHGLQLYAAELERSPELQQAVAQAAMQVDSQAPQQRDPFAENPFE